MALLEKRLRGLITDLSSSVARLAGGKVAPKNVHHLRTTIRRIESLISYANPDLNKKLERSLEKMAELRKRAGKVRDFDVQIGLLDAIGNGSTTRDRKALVELLEKKRDRQAARLVAAVKKIEESKFFSRIDRVAEQSTDIPEGKNRPLAPLEEASAQLAEMAKDFASHQAIKTSRLHDARVSLKRIRYLAELAVESEEKKHFIHELNSVQNSVGDWHDWQELTKTAEKRFSDRVNCPMLQEVRALMAARHATATSSIQHLFSLAIVPDKKPSHAAEPVRVFAQIA